MDEIDPEELILPKAWGRPGRSPMPTFGTLHGAYHVLHRRIQMELTELGLGPSEAVVLATLGMELDLTVATIRQRTGLRPSTLDSLLDRLESRRVLRRARPRAGRGEVILELTPAGLELAKDAGAALVEIEAELRVFASPASLAAMQRVFEAARALGVPGTAADL